MIRVLLALSFVFGTFSMNPSTVYARNCPVAKAVKSIVAIHPVRGVAKKLAKVHPVRRAVKGVGAVLSPLAKCRGK